MRPGIKPVSKKRKSQKVAPWQIGILAVGLLALLGLLYSLAFGGRPGGEFRHSAEEMETLQRQIDQGMTLNTPPEKLRAMGINLPAGYDERAAAKEAIAQGRNK